MENCFPSVSFPRSVYGNRELNGLVMTQDAWADLAVICLVLEKHSITIERKNWHWKFGRKQYCPNGKI